MSKFTFPNGSLGFDDTLVGIVQSSPEMSKFVTILLLFVYGSIFFSGFIGQKRRTGSGDAPLWAVLSGIATFLVTIIMSMKQGLVQIETLSLVIGITVASFIWLALTRGRYE